MITTRLQKNEKNIVIVCHGGVISALISHLANIPFFHFISHMGSDLTAVSKFELRQYVVSSICRNVDLAAKLVRQI